MALREQKLYICDYLQLSSEQALFKALLKVVTFLSELSIRELIVCFHALLNLHSRYIQYALYFYSLRHHFSFWSQQFRYFIPFFLLDI